MTHSLKKVYLNLSEKETVLKAEAARCFPENHFHKDPGVGTGLSLWPLFLPDF